MRTTSEKDPSYYPSSGNSSSSDLEEEALLKHCTDPKYIVFESQLEGLLYSLVRTKCYGGHISELREKVLGSMLTVMVVCLWECGDTLGIPAYNRACPCTKPALFCKCSSQWADL